MKKIKLKHGKEESLLRSHPWVFSGAIDSIDPDIIEGDLVEVYSSKDKLLATGHYQIGNIAVRILEFGDATIPDDFYDKRLLSEMGFC